MLCLYFGFLYLMLRDILEEQIGEKDKSNKKDLINI